MVIKSDILWSRGLSQKHVCETLGVSNHTMVDVFNFFRQICKRYFDQHPIKLGGEQRIIQIDESCFSSKPKYHRGRSPNPIWVFGMVDCSTRPALGYMEIVAKRDAKTLLKIIKKVAKPGSIIHSDQWRAYTNIERELGFEHRTVNHKLNFIDKISGVHTQTIESYWNKSKQMIKKMNGCRREHLENYLWEMMWRERHTNDTFNNFLEAIQQQYMFV